MLSLTIANFKMMLRNRQTTFWALFFPLLLVVVFGMFDVDSFGSASLVIIDEADTPRSQLLAQELAELEFLRLEAGDPAAVAARQNLSQGELDYLLVIPGGFGQTTQPADGSGQVPVTLVYDGHNRERNQLVEGAVRDLVTRSASPEAPTDAAGSVNVEGLDSKQVSYFDVVLLGLVGLGVMSHSIISIAVKISTYRNQSILKRMLVTPLPIWKYFAAEITSHLALALVQAGIILALGVFVFGAHIPGNLVWVFLVVMLGGLVFLNIGFILSAWANSPSAASGMGNAITLPMIFLAGTFFSTASLPWLLPYIAQVLPLTPMLSAMRQLAIDNVSLWQVWPQLATLTAWVAVTGLAATRVFRFS